MHATGYPTCHQSHVFKMEHELIQPPRTWSPYWRSTPTPGFMTDSCESMYYVAAKAQLALLDLAVHTVHLRLFYNRLIRHMNRPKSTEVKCSRFQPLYLHKGRYTTVKQDIIGPLSERVGPKFIYSDRGNATQPWAACL